MAQGLDTCPECFTGSNSNLSNLCPAEVIPHASSLFVVGDMHWKPEFLNPPTKIGRVCSVEHEHSIQHRAAHRRFERCSTFVRRRSNRNSSHSKELKTERLDRSAVQHYSEVERHQWLTNRVFGRLERIPRGLVEDFPCLLWFGFVLVKGAWNRVRCFRREGYQHSRIQ